MDIIAKIRKKNMCYRFKNELQYLSNEDNYFEWTKVRISRLKKLVDKYNN